MKNSTDMGKNRTGIDMSPSDSRDIIEEAEKRTSNLQGDETAIAEVRKAYTRESGPIGTVPPPGTVKGAAKSGMKKMTGKKPEVLINKIGARLAFERGGVRLYDAIIAKCEELGSDKMGILVSRLKQFRDEEAKHFGILRDALKSLGADPTAMTPAADITGVSAMGLLQISTDPRTSIAEGLEAVLIAELADNDGWEMLITLTDEMGMKSMANQFREALEEENTHLEQVRDWLNELIISREARAA